MGPDYYALKQLPNDIQICRLIYKEKFFTIMKQRKRQSQILSSMFHPSPSLGEHTCN